MQHEEECKKRQTEIHDRKLFTQPDETHLGECPLCFLPMPLDAEKSRFHSCCCSYICNGCSYADQISNKENRCPFCREPCTDDEEENEKRIMERVKANDPGAITYMGGLRYNKGDYDVAFEYWTKAADLGDSHAHHRLGHMYEDGLHGIEEEEEKAVYHYEKAAIAASPQYSQACVARHNLGCYEGGMKTTRDQ
jgi:hypothetical protein